MQNPPTAPVLRFNRSAKGEYALSSCAVRIFSRPWPLAIFSSCLAFFDFASLLRLLQCLSLVADQQEY